jgi:pyrroline-5-carboxylate reductase
MGRALARGLGEPVVVTDPVRERAEAVAGEAGGEAVGSAAEVAERADVTFLCHKPAQLDEVAEQLESPSVVSILAGTPIARLREAYPDSAVVRIIPNTAVALGRGVVCVAAESDARLTEQLRASFERLGSVVELPDAQIDAAMAVMSCGPAWLALVSEAQVDAAVRAGIPAAIASRLATGAMDGAAALLVAHDHDTLAVRREIASPGGTTAKGLAALESGGVRAAFADATEAAIGS